MTKTAQVMISNRHVHLNRQALDVLFGEGYELTVKRRIDGGTFAANETVALVGALGIVQGVRVLGPLRAYSQAEVLRADCYRLGTMAPVAISGTPNIAPITIKGPAGELHLQHGMLVAKRHLHISAANAAEWGLEKGQTVAVRVAGGRAMVFGEVEVAITDMITTVHLDVEEGNAAMLNNGDMVEIIYGA